MTALLLAVLLAAGQAPAPKGAIGLRLAVQDGKLTATEVIKGGPAMNAGLRNGDAIVKVNELKISNPANSDDQTAMIREVSKHEPGQMVVIRVKRGDKELSLEVIVGKYKDIFPKEEDERRR